MTQTEGGLPDWWPALQERVNVALSQYCELDGDCPDRLREAVAYSLLAGGKRLRPILTLLACDAVSGEWEPAIPAACALEMVHTYSLIHDDLPAMDDDDFRRGRATCHVQFDEATAILAGDALLTWAFQLISNEIKPPPIAALCCGELARAAGACGMVGGQMADLESEHTENVTIQQLESIHRRKTGRLLTCAVSLGARVAKADDETYSGLVTYGNCVGLAFQIADDLLDLTGSRERLGKAVRKDAQKGKSTYPALLGEAESRRRARQLIDEAIDAIRPMGVRVRRLESLARFVLERDH